MCTEHHVYPTIMSTESGKKRALHSFFQWFSRSISKTNNTQNSHQKQMPINGNLLVFSATAIYVIENKYVLSSERIRLYNMCIFKRQSIV